MLAEDSFDLLNLFPAASTSSAQPVALPASSLAFIGPLPDSSLIHHALNHLRAGEAPDYLSDDREGLSEKALGKRREYEVEEDLEAEEEGDGPLRTAPKQSRRVLILTPEREALREELAREPDVSLFGMRRDGETTRLLDMIDIRCVRPIISFACFLTPKYYTATCRPPLISPTSSRPPTSRQTPPPKMRTPLTPKQAPRTASIRAACRTHQRWSSCTTLRSTWMNRRTRGALPPSRFASLNLLKQLRLQCWSSRLRLNHRSLRLCLLWLELAVRLTAAAPEECSCSPPRRCSPPRLVLFDPLASPLSTHILPAHLRSSRKGKKRSHDADETGNSAPVEAEERDMIPLRRIIESFFDWVGEAEERKSAQLFDFAVLTQLRLSTLSRPGVPRSRNPRLPPHLPPFASDRSSLAAEASAVDRPRVSLAPARRRRPGRRGGGQRAHRGRDLKRASLQPRRSALRTSCDCEWEACIECDERGRTTGTTGTCGGKAGRCIGSIVRDAAEMPMMGGEREKRESPPFYILKS